MPIAVICVMHGYSFGLAIDMSTCADIRICASDTKFAVKEVDIGLAADIGTLSRLPKVVGNSSWVKEVALTARIFGAEEAYQVGFVSQVHDTKAKAIEAGLKLAELLATKSPIAVQGTKELLNHARDHSIADSKFIQPFPGSITKKIRSAIYWCLECSCRTNRRHFKSITLWNSEEKANL